MLRPDAARLESAEASLALRCGLANALREALDIGLDAIRARVDAIAQGLRAELATLPGVTVLDQGRERSGWCRSMWRAWTRRRCSARWPRRA